MTNTQELKRKINRLRKDLDYWKEREAMHELSRHFMNEDRKLLAWLVELLGIREGSSCERSKAVQS